MPASSSRSAPTGRGRNRRPGTSSSSAGPASLSSRSPTLPKNCGATARRRCSRSRARRRGTPAGSMRLHVAGALSSLDRDRMAPGRGARAGDRGADAHARRHPHRGRAPVAFDFLSIDVEGHELEVLGGFDLARWRPRLVLLEDHVGNLDKHRFSKSRWLSPDPPLRKQRLVCSTRRGRSPSDYESAGISFASTISPCRSASRAMRLARCDGAGGADAG